jgi:DUF1680 family protein
LNPTLTTDRLGPVALSSSSRVAVSPFTRRTTVLGADGFLGAWQALNGSATIPHCIEQLEISGAVNNFRRLVGESDADYHGPLFADSDVYKVLEAIAWEIGRSGTNDFTEFADLVIDLIGRVQANDGYINTFVQGGQSVEKLTALRWSHELYCLGHLIQAAVAWNRVTGRTDLLETSIRFVDLVERELGEGGRNDIDGHPEIETALVELYRTTGERRFLELAKRFIDERGHRTVGHDRLGYEYFQDHEPIREVTEAIGHAVRQLYLVAGVTDLVTEEEDHDLSGALDRIWSSVHGEKIYLTGGLGSRHRDEAFGDPFELPPDRAYSETCASIANFMWNWRMLLVSGKSQYADEMERGLYNGIAASTSVNGTEFFYANPLQLREGHRSEENATAARQAWYGCACCPPNLARLVGSLDHYVATTTATGMQLHLYSNATIALGNEVDAPVATVATNYPWDGVVDVTFDRSPADKELRLRLPGWAASHRAIVDGVETELEVADGYFILAAGTVRDSIHLEFDLTPVVERPHPRIDASRGTIAVRRGPVVYCLEQPDLPAGVPVQDVFIPADPELVVGSVDADLGVPTITITGGVSRDSASVPLYRNVEIHQTERELDSFELIPYFRWANRRQAAMRVWIPTR